MPPQTPGEGQNIPVSTPDISAAVDHIQPGVDSPTVVDSATPETNPLLTAAGDQVEHALEAPDAPATPEPQAAPAPALIDSSPFTQTPQPVEVPEPGVITGRSGNIERVNLTDEAKNVIGTHVDDVDGEANPVAKVDVEQVRVLEAHLQNVKAAMAEAQDDVEASEEATRKAKESLLKAMEIVAAGPQTEMGWKIGVNPDGSQKETRKVDPDSPEDMARVSQIEENQALMQAAAETPIVAPAPEAAPPAEGLIDGIPEHLQPTTPVEAPAVSPLGDESAGVRIPVMDMTEPAAPAAPEVQPPVE